MNITIIGALAGVGLATVKRALELGHRVTTLARRKVEIEPNENLTEIQGSALNEEDLKRAISGADDYRLDPAVGVYPCMVFD